jgi:hypothetical protein
MSTAECDRNDVVEMQQFATPTLNAFATVASENKTLDLFGDSWSRGSIRVNRHQIMRVL